MLTMKAEAACFIEKIGGETQNVMSAYKEGEGGAIKSS